MQPVFTQVNAKRKSLLEESIPQSLQKIVSLRGNMIDKGFFGNEKVFTILNIDLASHAVVIEHGINSKLSKRRFNIKEVD